MPQDRRDALFLGAPAHDIGALDPRIVDVPVVNLSNIQAIREKVRRESRKKYRRFFEIAGEPKPRERMSL